MLLSIDSSLGTSAAVVDHHGEVRSAHTSTDPRAHAELIGVLLERALADAGIGAVDVTAVVMGVGPGPYTGLRVGMAAAQAFALSRSLPLYPVVSHDGPGYAAGNDCVVVTDARRGEVAYSVYRAESDLRRVRGPVLVRPENLDEELGHDAMLPRVEPLVIEASELAIVALNYLENGFEFPSAAPVYLRAPDVTLRP